MILVIMGVSGVGKTTIAKMLSEQLGWKYVEGDDFHPPENVEKMRRGIALEDADRAGWLDSLSQAIDGWLAAGENVVLTCSALKEKYREQLSSNSRQVRFVYLKADYACVKDRLSKRTGHFMAPALLSSQYQALEEPSALSLPTRVCRSAPRGDYADDLIPDNQYDRREARLHARIPDRAHVKHRGWNNCAR